MNTNINSTISINKYASDAIYVDAKKAKSIVAIRPKPPFRPIFQVAVTKQGSGIRIINEPLSPETGVETGEAPSLPAQRYIGMWFNSHPALNEIHCLMLNSYESPS